MIATIHQPEHMPWLGFFHKISIADTFVILDNTQYRRRYFQNRNKIRTKKGWQWLTVPLEKEERDTLEIRKARIYRADNRWAEKNLRSVYLNYSKAEFFSDIWDEFRKIYGNDSYELLLEMNMSLINYFLEKFALFKNIIYASSLKVKGRKGDLILNILKEIGADTYVSGVSGRDYLDMGGFEKNNINVVTQEFHHPVYKQVYEPFIPCISTIDLLFNYGPGSKGILEGRGVSVLEDIFL